MKYLTDEEWAAAVNEYLALHSLSSAPFTNPQDNTAELLIEVGGDPDVALPYLR